MVSVYLICVGKLKETFYLDACQEYLKRLKGYCKLTLVEIPEGKLPQSPSLGEIAAALDKEGDAIRAKLPPGGTLVALCVEGQEKSSPELADFVQSFQNSGGRHLVFLIGGSYGLHPSIKAEARLRLSMSPMTFPHHLARVMVLEQIYRAFKINEGSSYHK